jgi:hypothetical protein
MMIPSRWRACVPGLTSDSRTTENATTLTGTRAASRDLWVLPWQAVTSQGDQLSARPKVLIGHRPGAAMALTYMPRRTFVLVNPLFATDSRNAI